MSADSEVSPAAVRRSVLAAKTHYEALGLPQGLATSTHDVLAAFRRRSIALHPDKAPSAQGHEYDAVECRKAFDMLVHARDVLAEASTRRAYDEAIHAGQLQMLHLFAQLVTPISVENLAQNASGAEPRFHQELNECPTLDAKRGRCARLGCLRPLAKRDAPLGTLCERCIEAPRKCEVFGCLQMTQTGLCKRHQMSLSP